MYIRYYRENSNHVRLKSIIVLRKVFLYFPSFFLSFLLVELNLILRTRDLRRQSSRLRSSEKREWKHTHCDKHYISCCLSRISWYLCYTQTKKKIKKNARNIFNQTGKDKIHRYLAIRSRKKCFHFTSSSVVKVFDSLESKFKEKRKIRATVSLVFSWIHSKKVDYKYASLSHKAVINQTSALPVINASQPEALWLSNSSDYCRYS